MMGIIWYSILVLLTIYLGIMYALSKAVEFLGFELLLLFAMFLLVRYLKRGITIRLESKIPVTAKGKPIPVRIHIRNNRRLPVTHLSIGLEFENGYSVRGGKTTISCSLNGKQEKTIRYDAMARYCGRVRFAIPKARIYDYLKICSFGIRCREEAQAFVLPDIREILVQVSEQTWNFPVEGDEYDPHRSGDDPSEIFQTREFRAGDTLQRVHWKMSARTDELITKEFSRPIGCSVLLLLDLYRNKEKKDSNYSELALMDTFLEIASSLSHGMMEAGCRHYVAWFEQETQEVVRHYIQEQIHVYEMIHNILHCPPYQQDYEMISAYQAKYMETSFSTVLILNTDLLLSRNGEMIADFSQGSVSETLEGFVLEV